MNISVWSCSAWGAISSLSSVLVFVFSSAIQVVVVVSTEHTDGGKPVTVEWCIKKAFLTGYSVQRLKRCMKRPVSLSWSAARVPAAQLLTPNTLSLQTYWLGWWWTRGFNWGWRRSLRPASCAGLDILNRTDFVIVVLNVTFVFFVNLSLQFSLQLERVFNRGIICLWAEYEVWAGALFGPAITSTNYITIRFKYGLNRTYWLGQPTGLQSGLAWHVAPRWIGSSYYVCRASDVVKVGQTCP